MSWDMHGDWQILPPARFIVEDLKGKGVNVSGFEFQSQGPEKKKKKFFKKLQKNIQLGRVSFSHPIRGGGEKPKQIDFDARETVGS